LKGIAGGAAAAALAPVSLSLADERLSNPVGYATISWPDEELTSALQTISALGFQGVQLLDFVTDVYPGPRASELAQHLAGLRLEPVTLSVHKVVLDPARPHDETANLRRDSEFFRTLKGHYLQVTDAGDPAGHYSHNVILAFGERLNDLGKVAKDYGLELAYHPHDRTLGQTREGLGQILDATDPKLVKLMADTGHLTLGGSDPSEVIRTYHQRLVALHFKDVRRDALELARAGHRQAHSARLRFCEVGQGAVNFPAIIDTLREVRFDGWVIFELDAYQPRPGGPRASAEMNRDAARRLGFRI